MEKGSSFVHLAGALFTDDTIFVSTDKGLLISPNRGASWNPFINYTTMGIALVTGDEGVVSFGGATRNNHTRFFCTTISAAHLTNRTEPRDIQYFKKIYRMDWNNAGLWSDITTQLKTADQSLNDYNYAYQVTINPDNPDTLYFTGQTHSPATPGGARLGTVFKTTDGGNTLNNIFLRNNNPTNAAMTTGWVGAAAFSPWEHTWNSINTTEGLCIDPNNVNRLMRSDFSIVCISEDGGATWEQRYVASGMHPASTLINRQDLYQTGGLQTSVCHWLQWLSPTRILVTYSDLLLNESNDGGNSWGFLYDSLWSVKVNDIQMLCVSSSGRIYAPEGEVLGNNGDWSDYRLALTNVGKIMYSDDAIHWHLMKDFQSPVSWASIDPTDSTTMYVSVLSALSGVNGGIWRCSGLPDNPVWTLLPAPARSEKRPTQVFALNNGDIVSVYGARDSSQTQPVSYSFTASSGVFISSDKGNTWRDLCAGYPGMQKDVRFLTIDPSDTNQNTWFLGVGTSGIGSVAGLYKTIDRGTTWTNIWAGKPVLGITKHPVKSDEMYICTTYDGLFYATGANTLNPVVTKVVGYPFRAPERVFFNPYDISEVWVASWGNGLRVGRLTATGISSLPLRNETITVFPNPSTGSLTFLSDLPLLSLRLVDDTGKTAQQQCMEKGTISYQIFGLKPGIYIYVAALENTVLTGKVIIK